MTLAEGGPNDPPTACYQALNGNLSPSYDKPR